MFQPKQMLTLVEELKRMSSDSEIIIKLTYVSEVGGVKFPTQVSSVKLESLQDDLDPEGRGFGLFADTVYVKHMHFSIEDKCIVLNLEIENLPGKAFRSDLTPRGIE